MKSEFYMTTGNDQLSNWTEKSLQSTFQSQTCTKNRSWSLFGGLLPVWSAQLSESWWNHYIWEVCSANRWDALKTAMPVASSGQQKGPKSSPWKCPITQPHFNSWKNWAPKFCLICHIHLTSCQLTTPASSILTTFCREIASTTSRMRKMLSKSWSNP